MAHEETRNGESVEGKYSYVDANGALVTVTYQAGPEGYTENREVEDGAVEMRTTYGAWDGPFADTVPAGVSSSTADIAQSATISTRGSSSLSGSSFKSAQTNSVVGSRQSSSAVGQSQSALISTIIGSLESQITAAVQAALSNSRPTPVVAVQPAPVRRLVRPVPVQRVAPAAVSSGLTGIFGVAGENNVRIETPDFTIGY